MCSNRYKEKEVKGCESKHIDEEVLKKAFVETINELIANKQYFLDKWRTELDSADALIQYRLKEFMRILEQEEKQEQFNESLCLRMLEQIEVPEGRGKMHITLLDAIRMTYENNN